MRRASKNSNESFYLKIVTVILYQTEISGG
jgi:hypothetical protein